jgi:hypothetical protein
MRRIEVTDFWLPGPEGLHGVVVGQAALALEVRHDIKGELVSEARRRPAKYRLVSERRTICRVHQIEYRTWIPESRSDVLKSGDKGRAPCVVSRNLK